MNDTPSNHNKLSEDDLAVLRAFETVEELKRPIIKNPEPASRTSTRQLADDNLFTQSTDPLVPVTTDSRDESPITCPPDRVPVPQAGNPLWGRGNQSPGQDGNNSVSDDMLVLFVTEADEEITTMQHTLHELEQEAPASLANSTNLVVLQRSAHKLKGTAGSIGYEHISTISRYIEILVEQVKIGHITHPTSLLTLAHAVKALEATLYSVASKGSEDSAPHTQLEQVYGALDIKLQTTDERGDVVGARFIGSAGRDGVNASRQFQHVDAHHLQQLMLHIEQLAEQRIPVEHAQAEVQSVQQELYAAQQRLQQIEIRLSSLPSAFRTSSSVDEPPMSSLVARILNESMRRVGHAYRRKNRTHPQSLTAQNAPNAQHWDELEMDADRQHEFLLTSLSEAIADVATASTRLYTAIDQLNRTLQKHMAQLALVRNDSLRLPHTHSVVRGLLIRVGTQRVVVPFSHIQRIDYKKPIQHKPLYRLNVLLGFPAEKVERVQTVLILQHNNVAVQVDEVLGEIEVLMKPLAPHLQRPGIAGSATGDSDTVLLVLDLPQLLMRTELAQHIPNRQVAQSNRRTRRTILVADDSVYIRQSVSQILNHAGYEVIEAHDGIEALEQLLTHRIDALLLDIEMPRLNGYDLLNVIRTNPLFPHLKVVMLTSRSSEKHQRHAYELGAHGYLTKPCPQDTLLTTIQSVLHVTK
jgi:CheY-like chemotaxis protein